MQRTGWAMNALYSFLLVMVSSAAQSSTAGYFVGNSLTWDSQPNGVAALANENGHPLTVGYHIRSNSSLDYIWNNPDDITITNAFGGYSGALPNNAWDFVTIQPFHSVDSTLSLDAQRILDVIALNESGPSTSTKYYIYEAWPRQPGDYKALWAQSVADVPDQQTVLAREYFDHLYDNVASTLGGSTSLHVIPIGEVLYELDLLFESGATPGFADVNQLFRDNNHLDTDIGRWVAANTVYATIFKEDPTGLMKPTGYYPPVGDTLLTDELNAQIQSVVWNVVSNDIHTGVVPVPAAVWFLGCGFIGLLSVSKRKI